MPAKTISICTASKNIAINEEVSDDKTLADLGVKREELEEGEDCRSRQYLQFRHP
jgi:hypothetical protein